MGCWNETCGLSNLPICSGDSVKMFILVKKQNFGRQYYFNDDAVPFVLPIEGEYDEYGSIENVKICELTLKVLESSKIYIKIEDDYTPFSFDLKSFLEQLERGRLYIKYGFEYHQLTQIMYHKDLYNLLVNDMKERIPYNNTESFFSLQRNKLAKKLEQKIKRREILEEMDDLGEPLYGQYSLGYKMTNAYEKFVTDKNKSLFLDELTLSIMFFHVLSFMRKSFYGQSGLGSQSTEMYLHKKMSEWIISFYDRTKEEYSEDLDDEEKENYELTESILWFSE